MRWRAGDIERPRLSRRVCLALESGSLLVEAPAGYGKTTLLRDAVSHLKPPSVWLRCTPDHQFAEQLIAAIVAAIDAAVPDADLGDAVALSTQPFGPFTAAAMVRELDAVLVDPVIIVVDSAEHLAGARDATAVLAELIRSESALIRVAVATRCPLRLALAKPTMAGRVARLGVADLSFDIAECAAYLAEARGAPANHDDVEALFLTSEGWPLAVGALVGSEAGIGGGAVRVPAELSAFLGEEVLEALDDAARRVVLASSLPRLLTPAVAAAAGLSDPHLDDLGALGLLVRLDGPADAPVAYHPLLRAFLLERLECEVPAEELSVLRRQVASAMAGEGNLAEAVEHWVAAQEWPAVVEVLEAHGEAFARTAPTLLRAWIAALPATVRSERAVRLLEGRLAWGSGDAVQAISLLTSAIGDAVLTLDPAQEWQARFCIGQSLMLLGRYDEAIALADGFDGERGFLAGAPAAASAAYAAHALACLGRVEESERMASAALDHPGAEAAAPVEFLRRAYLDLAAGHLDAVAAEARSIVEAFEPADPYGVHLFALEIGAFATAEQGYPDDALAWWQRMAAAASDGLHTRQVAVASAFQGLLQAKLGRTVDAEAELARHGRPSGWVGYGHAVGRALLAAHDRDHPAVLTTAREAVDAVRPAAPVHRFWAAADLVPALASVGAGDIAHQIASDALAAVESAVGDQGGRYLRARLGALEAWLRWRAGDTSASDEALRSALHHAGPTACHLFRREWARLEPVVSSALERSALDVDVVLGALRSAFPDGLAFVSLCRHPNPAVRRRALAPAVASGHPRMPGVVAELVRDGDESVAATAAALSAQILADPPPRVFETLGGFSVRRGAWVLDDRAWGRPVAPRLVRYLLVQGGSAVATDVLLQTFWPDLDPAGARRSLQVAASRVRAALDHPAAKTSVLEVTGDTYRLRLDETDVVDAAEFHALATKALAADPPNRVLLERARARWGGEPLPEERYSDWAASWREGLVDRYFQVLSALARLYSAAGDHHEAVAAGRGLVELDPSNEGAHRELMTAYARAGRRGRAIRQYLECRRTLVDELGVEPGDATSALGARILAGANV